MVKATEACGQVLDRDDKREYTLDDATYKEKQTCLTFLQHLGMTYVVFFIRGHHKADLEFDESQL